MTDEKPGPWHATPDGIRIQRVLPSGEVEVRPTRYGTAKRLREVIREANRES